MSKTYKCIICLDHGWLAVGDTDPNDIITLEGKLGEELRDRRLRKCECMTANKHKEDAEKLKPGGRR